MDTGVAWRHWLLGHASPRGKLDKRRVEIKKNVRCNATRIAPNPRCNLEAAQRNRGIYFREAALQLFLHKHAIRVIDVFGKESSVLEPVRSV